MSEAGDYSPGAWSGHDFGKARKTYDVHVGRSYSAAKTSGKTANDLLPDSLTTQSSCPLIIACDVTGSMGDWPATIFSKLPYLDHECKTEYLGEDYEVCFGAIGDADKGDTYPVQAREFAKGTDIKDRLTELVIERGGGGGGEESYELAALYFLHNVTFPNAVKKPILIIIGDEMAYSTVSKDVAKTHAKVDISRMTTTEHIFKKLKEKYSVYIIRKPYGRVWEGGMDSSEQAVREQWTRLLGAGRIANLPSADRVVDVIFGILAREAGRIDYFKEEIEERQRLDQVDTVYESLKTIHSLPSGKKGKKGAAGKSVMHQLGDGKKTKPLI